ncbi:major facilitator superfamily domain-containing protein [Aspergillus heterothallicus]
MSETDRASQGHVVLDKAASATPDMPRFTENEDKPFSLAWQERLVIASLMVIGFFASFEATGMGAPLPIIVKSLNATSEQSSWVGTSYFIGATALQPLFTSFSHIFSRKSLTLTALILFLVGTIMCSVAHDIHLFLAGRTIQGIGSGGCIAMVDVIITDLIPLRERAKYFGFMSMSWALATIIGPIACSTFAQNVTWRWIFWVLIPFNVTAIIISLVFLRISRPPQDIKKKLLEIDYIGAALWHTLVPLILGVVGITVFVCWEIYMTSYPLIPMRIFARWTAAQGYLGIVRTGMTMWAAVYYLPQYFEGVLGYSFKISAVGLLPLTLSTAPGAAVTGALIIQSGCFRRFLWIGWTLTVMGAGLIIDLKADSTIPQWIFLTLFAGIGIGMILSSAQISVQAAADDKDTAFAAGMVPELRTLGQAIGLAVYTAAFTNVVNGELSQSAVLSTKQVAGLSRNVYALVHVISSSTSDPALKDALRHALWLGFRAVWIVTVPFLEVSAVASIWTKPLKLDRVLVTEHVVQEQGASTESVAVSA